MAAKAEKSNGDDNSSNILTLHEMFRIVGDQMTAKDVQILKQLCGHGNGLSISEEMRSRIHSGYEFLLALEKLQRVDSSNFRYILYALRVITRHDLIQYVTLRRRKTVELDPVEQFLEQTAPASVMMPSWCYPGGKQRNLKSSSVPLAEPAETEFVSSSAHQSLLSPQSSTSSPTCSTKKRHKRSSLRPRKRRKPTSDDEKTASDEEIDEIKKKVTCGRYSETCLERPHVRAVALDRWSLFTDIRLRVRAEYCHHDGALEGNIFSNKPDLVERQFEKFSQANTILKSRDLGSIICDIKFSELTYLDAFWRDYINGSLLEALKGVFITESLKQAVGHEAIKLLVNVDEDDYEAGRLKLLQNLQE